MIFIRLQICKGKYTFLNVGQGIQEFEKSVLFWKLTWYWPGAQRECIHLDSFEEAPLKSRLTQKARVLCGGDVEDLKHVLRTYIHA